MHALIMSEKSHHHYVLNSVTLWNKGELHLLIMQIRDYFCLIFNLSRGTFKFTPLPNVLLCFRVERHVSWKRVQRCATGFEKHFLLFGGCVKNVSPISSNMYISRAVLKTQLAQ